jgi:hypothetical protein
MDSMITAAARALAAGDPLGALKRVALREDAAALALRGTAMAQLGDYARARVLMRSAAKAFSPRETVARARCVVAEAEIALASRELTWPVRALDAARVTLDAHGDRINAAHAHYLALRRWLLIGQVDMAETALKALDPAQLPAAMAAVHHLIEAGIALRRRHARAARVALDQATRAAREARIPALIAEVEQAWQVLKQPVAAVLSQGHRRLLLLDEVEVLLRGRDTLLLDVSRRALRQADHMANLATRPVLFALARLLAEAWPQDVPREVLITNAFRTRHIDETHRARLRVEIGRLRAELRDLADVHASKRGFVLHPHDARTLLVLVPPVEDDHAAVLAFLSDGESWSSSALALALGISQRSVQRALDALASAGKVQSFGQGRARRWLTQPVPGFATSLLLPMPVGGD